MIVSISRRNCFKSTFAEGNAVGGAGSILSVTKERAKASIKKYCYQSKRCWQSIVKKCRHKK